MTTRSDEEYKRYREMDFGNAKNVAQVPHLRALQADAGNKRRITMRIDADVLAVFREHAELTGANYQTLMNDALRQFAQGVTLTTILDRSVREAIATALKKPARDKIA